MVLEKKQYQTNQSTIQKPSGFKKKPTETGPATAILCDLLSSTEGAKRSPKHCQCMVRPEITGKKRHQSTVLWGVPH